MGKKKKQASPKATGLTIARNKNKFTFSWKIPSAGYGNGIKFYLGQRHYVKGTGKKKGKNVASYVWGASKSLGKNISSKTQTFDVEAIYPKKTGNAKKLTGVGFKVHGSSKDTGKINYTGFGPTVAKYFPIYVPRKPSISIERKTAWTNTITVSSNCDDTSKYWATSFEYITKLHIHDGTGWNHDYSKGKVVSYDIGKHSRSINHAETPTEQVTITDAKAAYRTFSVRTRGPAGDCTGGWQTKTISYAGPQPAFDISATVMPKSDTTHVATEALYCEVTFYYYHWTSRPIDTIKIQYAFAEPDAELDPASPQWEEAAIGGDNTIKPPAKKQSESIKTKMGFTINSSMPDNQLLFVRVITTNNNIDVVSDAVLCYDSSGEIPDSNTVLAKPTINSITPPQASDNKIVVSIDNNCTAEDANLAIVFLPDVDSEYSDMEIGIIETNPPSQSQSYSYTVEIPPDYTGEYRIGSYAFIGDYELSAKIPEDYDEQTPPEKGYKIYSVVPLMRSDLETFGGSIPLPPTNISVKNLGDGNVAVSWDWNWTEADSAEIAWSDYSMALDSTEQPSTYTVSNQKNSKLIVRNLEMGKTWYFWVRLIKGENTSIWSNCVAESLTSSPNIPSLNVSKENITMDETVTLSWAYTSVDGSAQSFAKVCQCHVSEGAQGATGSTGANEPDEYSGTYFVYDDVTYVIDRIIAEVDGEDQFVVIDPKDEKIGWSSGNSYVMSMIVGSKSGTQSASWSEPVTVNIVEGIESNILSTSLYPTALPYNSSRTYSSGSYTLRIEKDPDNKNVSVATLYKATSTISTPEEWNIDHWAVDDDQSVELLKSLDLTIDIEHVEDLTKTLRIERAEDYFVDRPDGDEYGGYEGELVYESSDPVSTDTYTAVQNPTVSNILDYYEYNSTTHEYAPTSDTTIVYGKTYYTLTVSEQFVVTQDSLYGYLDDGADYNLVYQTEDEYGQTSETWLRFRVNWTHQALEPNADVEIVEVTNDDEKYEVAVITINTPESGTVAPGDVCDIYRVSADGVELIYAGAEFGEKYVDPYPTIGEHGGHRVVYRTVNGDYIMENNVIAWIMFDDEDGDIIYSDGNIIDFDDAHLKIMFNLDLSNSWSKDFQQTHYLGGSIQGDWNSGVTMTSSISTNVITDDWDTISKLRALANYDGLCHVRTRDGMNYSANIEVNERIPYEAYYTPEGNVTNVGEYSLNITKIDPIELDGLTYKDWLENISNGELPPDETP